MKNRFQIVLIIIGLLFGQTEKQIKQAKEIIQQRSMSENQIKNAAKAKGFSDEQINSFIQKEKNSKMQNKESLIHSEDKIELLEPEKVNDDSKKSIFESTNSSELEISLPDDDNLEVIDEQEINIESKESTSQQILNHFYINHEYVKTRSRPKNKVISKEN